MALAALAPGALLSGRYLLSELIGQSDLSQVYVASDQRGQAQVALKIFDRAVLSRSLALSEYQTLARQASALGVEGIARAYDFGIDANSGLPFSTAERIGWSSLDRRVLAHGPLGLVELSRGLSVLARALDAAHAAGLVHRDLKPQNVFISPDNPEWVRITDFGVSAVRRGASEAMGWGGPPGYTPAEAVDAAAPASPAADLFALGVIVFFALTRSSPFRSLRGGAFEPTQHWAELNQPLVSLSERAREVGVALDPALDAWFARALAFAPRERFASANEMARELTTLAAQLVPRGPRGTLAMPGIAAAIAQPLVFQPEPSAASLGLDAPPVAATSSPTRVEPAFASASVEAPSSAESPDSFVPRTPKQSSALPLLIGLGVVLLAGVALAGYALLGNDAPPKPAASASAAPSPAPVTPSPPAPSAASVAPAHVRFTCEPGPCDSVVCDGSSLSGIGEDVELAAGPHECSAARSGFGAKTTSFTASSGQLSNVVFELSALPAIAHPQVNAPKPTPAPAAAAPVKPAPAKPAPAKAPTPKAAAAAKTAAAAPAPAKTTAAAAKKKKCSTFLGCK